MDRLTTQENPQTIFRNNLNLCYNRKHDSFVCYIKASILFIIYISSLKFEKKMQSWQGNRGEGGCIQCATFLKKFQLKTT